MTKAPDRIKVAITRNGDLVIAADGGNLTGHTMVEYVRADALAQPITATAIVSQARTIHGEVERKMAERFGQALGEHMEGWIPNAKLMDWTGEARVILTRAGIIDSKAGQHD